MRRPATALVALLLLAPSAGCQKAATPQQTAVARFDAWRKEGGRPGDPTFDALVVELEAVPPGAPEYAQARQRLEELRAAPPPAAGDAGAEPPPRVVHLPPCAALEEELALADGDRRGELTRLVNGCLADAGLPPLPDAGVPAAAPQTTGEPEQPAQDLPESKLPPVVPTPRAPPLDAGAR
jgi:hypothetical protein